MSFFWVWTTAVSLGAAERRARMHAGDPGDLARGLRDAVEHVDPASQVDDGHQQDQEDDDGERELDQGLAAVAPASEGPHHWSTGTTLVIVELPAEFETARVTVKPGALLCFV